MARELARVAHHGPLTFWVRANFGRSSRCFRVPRNMYWARRGGNNAILSAQNRPFLGEVALKFRDPSNFVSLPDLRSEVLVRISRPYIVKIIRQCPGRSTALTALRTRASLAIWRHSPFMTRLRNASKKVNLDPEDSNSAITWTD